MVLPCRILSAFMKLIALQPLMFQPSPPGSVRTALALVLGKCTLLENDQLMISRRMETALMRRINLCALFLNVSVIFRSLYAFKAIVNLERAIFFNPCL